MSGKRTEPHPLEDESAFEEQTSTHRKFGMPVDEMLERIDSKEREDLHGVHAELISSLALLVDDQEKREEIIENIRLGVGMLEDVSQSADHPEIAHEVSSGLMNLAIGIFSAATEIACQAMDVESSTQANIYRINALKSEQIGKAKAIASEFWRADSDCEYRLKEVAEIVIDTLIRDGVAVPGVEQVKKWIRPVAPDYATKGGRPKKL